LKKSVQESNFLGEGKGLFITFEGVEGCGKSTQMELLKGWFEKRGGNVLAVREPGGTKLGEKVRAILLDSQGEGIDPYAELFLYEACRAQLVNNIIRPALQKGLTVICDRFTDSTLAYQGYGRGLDIGAIISANALATKGLTPSITVLIDCDPEVGLRRAWKRIEAGATGEDRFEREAIAFHRNVRAGYLEMAQKEPGRIKVVDGSREIPLIHREICDIIKKVSV
jgi:dTMP kinase